MSVLDVVILGGGPAGMSAALVAGRARLRTIIVNAEAPRNAVTTASHGFLTRDGAHPTELLAVSKEQLTKYKTVRYVFGRAIGVSRHAAGFEVELSDGARFVATRIIVATGHRDELARLRLPGIEAVYGKSVYPCPFCDGYEHRDERLAVFGGEGIEHFVPVVRVWSEDVVVFTNGVSLSPGVVAAMAQRGVRVVQEPVARLRSEGGALQAVELSDGERIPRDSGFIGEDYSTPATNFLEVLGVPLTQNDWGMEVPDVDSVGKSKVPGVYAIGDARSGFGGLIAAANEGSECMSNIVHEIAAERWRRGGE